MTNAQAFKVCPMCSTVWQTRDQFLHDESIAIVGYGADFEKLDWSLFYFNHNKEGCFSTIVIEARHFLDLYKGKQYTQRRTGKEDCPGYCLDENQLDRCEAMCECAFNREIIKIIREKRFETK